MSDLLTRMRSKIILPSQAMTLDAFPGGSLIDLQNLGILPGISGGAAGFNQAGDAVTQTADGRDLNAVWADYQASLAAFNAGRDRLMSVLTFPVNQPIEDVLQGGDTINFEAASEFGVPRGVRTAVPSYFSLGYSFRWYDLAARYTWVFLAESEARQVDALHAAILEADNRNMFNRVFSAIFNNVTRIARIKQNNYNVYPLYNGDSVVPPPYKGNTFSTGHTHYIVSGGTAVDAGDLDDMYTKLSEHGYSWQEGTATFLLGNAATLAPVRALRVATGSPYDFVLAQSFPEWMIPTDLATVALQTQVSRPAAVFRGLPVIGRYGPWLIIEDEQLPNGYVVGLASGGNLDARNPVGVREHLNAGLRGLRLVKGPDPDYPLVDSYYQRGFGTGIRQRGAGVVLQTKASGSYDIPTAYNLT